MPGPDQIAVPKVLPVAASSWHGHTAVLAGHAAVGIAVPGVTAQAMSAVRAVRAAAGGTSTKLAGCTTSTATKVTTADAVFVSTEACREAAVSIDGLLA